MPDQARRKERQRLKREKRKAQMRRAASQSPYERVGTVGEVEACYINADWHDKGMASLFLLRRNPAGGHAMAAFLIDIWCVGLKDTWGRLDFTAEELDEYMKRARERSHAQLVRIGLEDARRLVAASIRFAHKNGFRLPDRYERWVKLLGELAPISDSDLTRFGKGGKLLWIGPVDDLRKRLIACTPEEFFSRPDVVFIAGDESRLVDAEQRFHEELDQLIENYTSLIEIGAAKATELVSKRLSDRGERPLDRIEDAVTLIFALGFARRALSDDEDEDISAAKRLAAEQVLSRFLGSDKDANIPQVLEPVIEQAFPILDELGEDVYAIGSPKEWAEPEAVTQPTSPPP